MLNRTFTKVSSAAHTPFQTSNPSVKSKTLELHNSPKIFRYMAPRLKPNVLPKAAATSQTKALNASLWRNQRYLLGAIATVSAVAIGIAAYNYKHFTLQPPVQPQTQSYLPLSSISLLSIAAAIAAKSCCCHRKKEVFNQQRYQQLTAGLTMLEPIDDSYKPTDTPLQGSPNY